MSSLDDKVEQSIVAHLGGEDGVDALGRNLLKGQTSDDQVLDSIIVHSESGNEEPMGSGNWFKTVTVQVRTRAGKADPSLPDEDRGAVHATAVEQVDLALSYPDLDQLLTAEVEGFCVQGAVFDRRLDNRQATARTFRTTFSMKLYCCASDLS